MESIRSAPLSQKGIEVQVFFQAASHPERIPQIGGVFGAGLYPVAEQTPFLEIPHPDAVRGIQPAGEMLFPERFRYIKILWNGPSIRIHTFPIGWERVVKATSAGLVFVFEALFPAAVPKRLERVFLGFSPKKWLAITVQGGIVENTKILHGGESGLVHGRRLL